MVQENGVHETPFGNTEDLKAASVLDNILASYSNELPKEYTCENGVVLALRPVTQGILRRSLAQHPMPDPPMILIEEKGREEENPNDPDYLRAVGECHDERLKAVQKALLIFGTSVKSVPAEVFSPDSDDWIEMSRAIGVEPDVSSAPMRYGEWLSLFCLTQRDHVELVNLGMRLSGVLEQEVLDAMMFFLGREKRRAYSPYDTKEGDRLGDNDSEPGPRNGTRA